MNPYYDVDYDPIEDLFDSIRLGDTIRVIQLLDQGTSLECRQRQTGDTPLISSVRERVIDICWVLLDRGANVNARNDGRVTALIMSCLKGQVEVAKMLIHHAADCSASVGGGLCALTFATIYRNREIVELLLKAGAEPDTLPVGPAVSGGGSLDGGGMSGTQQEISYRPLRFAVSNRDKVIAELLLQYKADVNAREYSGRTILMFAVINGFHAMIPLLLHYGADPDLEDDAGIKALDFAPVENHEIIAAMIREHAVKSKSV
mmetsp:Transcript_1458/g.2431  ORF Transcript_1458/g.2431 Transcript_1458/m.2431 type:complete len:261 (+) Transcript_1458:110-892(+)|eukprot:CAMPEP_0184691440 /NCGR_PEP_ID=MMETSP0313-20130426/296_1 /TAXON_ID=2792 /ORGANISM="Porphyridium aerugineum, Strain SAG 1380-2" /LENGTH=260 /DNA_ID=CAMNT_0027149159 /DNA_START=82 /DNA_END=864 /DNA_ORIENTATION=-